MCRRRGRTREGRKNQRVKIAEVEWQESRQHHDFPWTKELMSKMTAYIETVKSVTITDEVQLSMTWEEMMGPSRQRTHAKCTWKRTSEDITKQVDQHVTMKVQTRVFANTFKTSERNRTQKDDRDKWTKQEAS